MKKPMGERDTNKGCSGEQGWSWLPPVSAAGLFLAERAVYLQRVRESGGGEPETELGPEAEAVEGDTPEQAAQSEFTNLARFMATLSSVVPELDLEPEDGHLAWELARLCARSIVGGEGGEPPMIPSAGAAVAHQPGWFAGLVLLMLAVVWSNRNGNTCLILREQGLWGPGEAGSEDGGEGEGGAGAGAGGGCGDPVTPSGGHHPWSFASFVELFRAAVSHSRHGEGTDGGEGLGEFMDLAGLPDQIIPWLLRCPLVQVVQGTDGGVGEVEGESPDGINPLLVIREQAGEAGCTVALAKAHRVEARLGSMLRIRVEQGIREIREGDRAGEAIDGRSHLATVGSRILNEEQLGGVLRVIDSPFTVISGGPGTGKTATVGAILRALALHGTSMDRVALVAPTGKAANRMMESLKEYAPDIRASGGGVDQGGDPSVASPVSPSQLPEAFTIHRLLGYLPYSSQFAHGPDNLLPYQVVIMDEASMADQFLMEQLLGALDPQTKLVLLGDADQLPSVNQGAVLGDLARAAVVGGAPESGGGREQGEVDGAGGALSPFFVRLEKSYRMDQADPDSRAIYCFAQSLNKGEITGSDFPSSMGIPVREQPGELKFRGVEVLLGGGSGAGAALVGEFLKVWWDLVFDRARGEQLGGRPLSLDGQGFFTDTSQIDVKRLYDRVAEFRILCLTRHWVTGTEHINKEMNRMTAYGLDQGRGRNYSPPGRKEGQFLPGEPVMMLRNDYGLEIFNGDQGVVVEVEVGSTGRVQTHVAFPRQERFVGIPVSSLIGRIEHSYGITVHKSQGSEYGKVAVMLPHVKNERMLNRALLYTAVTRSKHSVVLVGRPAMVVDACQNRAARLTGLPSYLSPR